MSLRHFDYRLFGVSAREASGMDPQMRMLLTCSSGATALHAAVTSKQDAPGRTRYVVRWQPKFAPAGPPWTAMTCAG